MAPVVRLPNRKRTVPAFFYEDFSPKRPKSPAKSALTRSSSGYVFLAVKTEDDPDGFYLARAKRCDYPTTGEFPVWWLKKVSSRGGIYKLEFADKIHARMVICEVKVAQSTGGRFQVSAEERRKIVKGSENESEEEEVDEDEESESESEDEEPLKSKRKSRVRREDVSEEVETEGQSEEASEEQSEDWEPVKKVSAPKKRGRSKAGGSEKKSAGKRAKKEKKIKPKKVGKNYVVPNDELVPNLKVKLFPEGDDGFLASASTNYVSGFVASKLIFRAISRGDAKMVQYLVDEPSKCPSLNVPRSVDIEMSPFVYALAKGNEEILSILAKELFMPGVIVQRKVRPALETPLLSTISSGTYNVRSLGVPVIRDVMMSRGSREGVNALTQDEDHYHSGNHSDHLEDVLLRNCIPLETLKKVLTDNMSYDVISLIVAKIDHVMIHGHWQLAGRLVESCKDNGVDTFNYLHVAALTKKDLSTIGAIRAASVTKKTMRNMGISPLHCAAVNPNPEILREFLRVSPDYNITDKKGRRPIHFAAACQTSGPLKVLLSAGVPYFEPDSTGGTPLTYASIVGRTENVKLLLEQAKKDQSGTGQEDTSQASQAITAKYGPCAINKTARDGKGALHHAAANNHLEICKLLVENGANVDLASGSEKRTALMMAATFGNLNIVKYLVEHGKALVERRDRKLRTALIFAVKNGHAHITAYLLRLGADPNTADSSGNRAVHYASAYGWLDCLNLLIAAGADCVIENDWNMTPLAVSFLKGHIGITRELLKQPGADVNFRDKNGRTLVMLTCLPGVTEPLFNQLTFLVTQMKADAKLVDVVECNALHFLACSGDASSKAVELRNKMARLLLDAGCSASHENISNQTPVNLALESYYTELVELLLSRGGVLSHKQNSSTSENAFHTMARNCMYRDYSAVLDQLKLRVDPLLIDQMIKAKNSAQSTPLMIATETYGTRHTGHDKGKVEYDESVKQCHDFLMRLVEEFGAGTKEIGVPDHSEDKTVGRSDTGEEGEENVKEPTPKSDPLQFIRYLLLPQYAPPALDLIRKFRLPVNEYDSTGQTFAILAASQGNLETLRFLIDFGADLNLATRMPAPNEGLTPLLISCLNNRFEVLTYLIENAEATKIDLNAAIPSSGDSVSSLLCGVDYGSVDQRLKYLDLLTKKANFNPNFVNKRGRSLLMLAIGANKRQVDSSNVIERFLIGKGADCYQLKDDHGRTALHWLFLSAGNTEATPSLIGASSDPVDLLNMLLLSTPSRDVVDVKDALDRTPLHYAAACGTIVCCIRLLARGANIDAVDKNGDTPLSLAVRFKQTSVIFVLIQSKPNLNTTVEKVAGTFFPEETTLSEKSTRKIIEWQNRKLVEQGQLIGHVARVDLFSAVIRMHWQGLTSLLIDVLIEKDQSTLFDLITGSLTSTTFNLASSLLDRAAENQELADLIKTRTGCQGRGFFAFLAISVTKTTGSNSQLVLKVANQIANLGCDAMATDMFGCTPLHYACLNHYEPLVEFFSAKLTKGKAQLRDKFGRSPIHALFWNLTDFEAASKIREILPIIAKVDDGIDSAVDFCPLEHVVPPATQKCTFGRSDYFTSYNAVPATTCLIRCVQSSHYLLTADTLKAGANPDAKGANGLTPIMAAVLANSVECFLVLLSKTTEKEAFEARITLRLHERLALNFLKPAYQGGYDLTPEELRHFINPPKPPPKPVFKNPAVPTFSSGTLLVPLQEEQKSGEGESESSKGEGEKEGGVVEEVQPPVVVEKLPFLIPIDSNRPVWSIPRDRSSCAIGYSILHQIEPPKNTRKIDLMGVETSTGNNVLHLVFSTPYRNTLEARFLAYSLTEMERRLTSVKNNAGQTPQQLMESLEPKMIRSQSSALRASKAVDLDKICEDWLSQMKKLAEQKRNAEEKDGDEEEEDDDEEFIPDKRFASYSTSKIVRDETSQRPFNALMSKIDLAKGGFTEFNFYQLQLIQIETTGLYVVFTRWGRIGSEGMFQQTPFKVFKDAETEFCKIFKQKSGNDWLTFLTDGFTVMPKRYRLVTLDRPDQFSQLTSVKIDLKISEKTTSLPKPEFDVMKSIVEASLNSINNGTIFQSLSQIHLTPFGLVSQQSLKDAYRLLNELEEIVFNNPVRRRYSRGSTIDEETMARLKKVERLSEDYYHIVPRAGFAYCEVYPLTEANAVRNEMKKIDLLLNLQASTRLLLAAEQNKMKENPCDFVLSCLGMTIRPVNPVTKEAQDILRYIAATWSPKENGGVEAIYKLDRPKEVDQQAALKLGNRRLLWHGTKLQNLLGIFSTGLQASPEGVQHNGQSFGDGIYLSDVFSNSISYCDSQPGKPSFMILCDVALGNSANVDARSGTIVKIPWGGILLDARFSTTTADNATLPYGGLISNLDADGRFYHPTSTEYIVKNSKQIVLKYLIKFWH